jgi:hypothetical protein
MVQRQHLHDHAPHGHAQNMRRPEAQRVHQADRIGGHVRQRVGRFSVEFPRQARIAIVEADDVEPCRNEGGDEVFRPLDHLGAEAADQDERRALRIAVPRHLQRDPVRENLTHASLRSWLHLAYPRGTGTTPARTRH